MPVLAEQTFHSKTRIISWEARSSAMTQGNISSRAPTTIKTLLTAAVKECCSTRGVLHSGADETPPDPPEQIKCLILRWGAHPSPPLEHNSCTPTEQSRLEKQNLREQLKDPLEIDGDGSRIHSVPSPGREWEPGEQRWYLLMCSLDGVQDCEHCQCQQHARQEPSPPPQS